MNGRSLGLAAGSGLLLAATFPFIDLHFFAWVAFIPFFFAVYGESPKTAFWLGAVMGLVFFGGTVYWVTNSIHFYGHIPLLPASLITLLLCAYLALYPAVFGAAVVAVRRNYPDLMFLTVPALWTALELARTYVFSGFPWALLGYSQHSLLPVIQMADITGVYGVSFLIVFVNTALMEFLLDRKKYYLPIMTAVVVGAVLTYGFMQLREPEGRGSIKVSVVQGNIEQDKKWDTAYQADVIATYTRLTKEALRDRPDLVIWPETATPFYFGGGGKENIALTADLRKFVRMNNTALLFGSPTYEVRPGRVVRLRNSAFFVTRSGAVEAMYHKLHLVPFGEYVPLKSVLFFVEKMVQAIGDFRAGKEYTVVAIQNGQSAGRPVKLSTVICYEIIFPDLVRRFVDRGASVMTTITNDAWFGRTSAPYQHFTMAVFRAVENRVPVARAANTGVSGFIDAKGRVIEKSHIFTETYLTQTLTPGNRKTLYTQYGDVFAYACSLLAFVMLIPSRQGR
jgi:apolipoprotein N-acyltransferase